ncbi:hypothetical protein HO173_000029 [Letharia columbiana]|uniref:DEUBAD domain-containing protein n=1 Tax=Letharia columbiana TaxID=112416 RepID=A0A8H6LAA4_9LECA|nr:uncharacterized protein HO173_000029 [Letharia columbiana]KAF6241319.1 hypothetical protein HO173_000029 [Letharia columbiana]
MIPQKRKADAASPAEASDESPHKRAKSESIDDIVNKPDSNTRSSDESSEHHVEQSISVASPSSNSRTVPGEEDETALPTDLPQTWDQASDADKMLVKMKEENTKSTWAKIEQRWERATGKKPAGGVLPDRYWRLKKIMASSKAGGAIGGNVESKVVEELLETSEDISTLPTNGVRRPSPAIGGPSEKSSRTISKLSEPAIKSLTTESAASANEIAPEKDFPQSWEHANAGDQLIVRMKTSRKAWPRIEEAWQDLTGETPAEGALRDRYMGMRELVICPGIKGPYTKSTFDRGTDQAVSRRAKDTLRTPRKQKVEAEPSEESSNESSSVISKHSKNIARRKPRGAVEKQMRANAFDGPSDERFSRRTKTTAEEASDGKPETGFSDESDESDETSKQSLTVVKSAKRPRSKHANSGAQNTAGTADEMVVEMKERGCNWVEISKAWTERTGLTHAPDTLRKRYARMKNGSAAKLVSKNQASSKRKVKATSPDEGSFEASAKRNKSTTETPIKRNMDRGKRKSSVKYTDSTTDEDELFAAPVEPVAVATTPAKRNAGRAAKVNRSDPEWLVTNEKSPLADEDLHAEFSNPKTYENFTKSDWEDLRETLPPNVPINSDGYSIPMAFFKYDPDFRRGIREFQEDLSSGRLDPKWQADAAQAMEERAQGQFDAYKESQFEAFWGQKQKLNHDALAGESTKIKLDLLIQNEIFKVGDYFSYSRVFGRGKNGVLVEKDCKIVKVDDKTLTFAIPPGQRKYSRRMFESGPSGDTTLEAKATTAGDDEQSPVDVKNSLNDAEAGVDNDINARKGLQASENGNGVLTTSEMAENGNLPDMEPKEDEALPDSKADEHGTGGPTRSEGTAISANTKPQEDEIHEATASEGDKEDGATVQTNGDDQLSAVASQDEDVLHSISYLTQLENKIVDIDGHFNSKDIATQNSWKNFRGIRNHQDLGTLFEMREDFYVYKHPQIVKKAKRKR